MFIVNEKQNAFIDAFGPDSEVYKSGNTALYEGLKAYNLKNKKNKLCTTTKHIKKH